MQKNYRGIKDCYSSFLTVTFFLSIIILINCLLFEIIIERAVEI